MLTEDPSPFLGRLLDANSLPLHSAENGLYSVFLGFILMRNEGTDVSEPQPVVLDKLKSGGWGWGEILFCRSRPSLAMDGWGDV